MKPDGMPITSSSAMTAITAAMAAPAIFSALISTFQTAQTALVSVARHAGATGRASLSRKGMSLKEAKNNPRVLQSYVTYDTLGAGNPANRLRGRVGPIWKVLR